APCRRTSCSQSLRSSGSIPSVVLGFMRFLLLDWPAGCEGDEALAQLGIAVEAERALAATRDDGRNVLAQPLFAEPRAVHVFDARRTAPPPARLDPGDELKEAACHGPGRPPRGHEFAHRPADAPPPRGIAGEVADLILERIGMAEDRRRDHLL